MRRHHHVRGLLNTLTSVIVGSTAFAMPMVIWLMYGYFRSIPAELEESAMVDGCSRFGALRRIILPISAPGLAAGGIYAFIMDWDQLMFPLTFLTRSELRPVPLALYDFAGYNIVYWHEMMAAGAIAVIPAAVAFALVQRYLVGGAYGGRGEVVTVWTPLSPCRTTSSAATSAHFWPPNYPFPTCQRLQDRPLSSILCYNDPSTPLIPSL